MGLFERSRHYLRTSLTVGPVLLAVVVGLMGGSAAILFKTVLGATKPFFFQGTFLGVKVPYDLHVIVLPVIGLLLVDLLVRLGPEADGTGIPRVMYAVRRQGGRVRRRAAPLKAVAAITCLATGGSLGREGPIVHIGSSLASSVSQAVGLGAHRTRVLVACGAAAAVGANFNAPIAGSLFALEVILGSFGGRDFGQVVVASVAGTALSRVVLGHTPAFSLPQRFELLSAKELGLYLVLGVLLGLLAIGFKSVLYGVGDLLARIRGRRWPRSLIGGLVVGVVGWIGMRFLGGPYLFGVGYDGIETALRASPVFGEGLAIHALMILVALMALKIVATSFTLGGGGSGGVFAPALFIGAMAGAAFGVVAGEVFETGIAPPGAYALVGMAALFGAAAHAPISTVVILFEMSDDYHLILPLMLAVGVAYLVASRLSRDSVYTLQLRRLGGFATTLPEASTLDLVLVADAMVRPPDTVQPDTPLTELASRLRRGGRSLPVLNDDGDLVGVVTAGDVWRELTADPPRTGMRARDLMSRDLVTATPDETLREVLTRLSDTELAQVLVVDRKNPALLLGVLRREEIFWAVGELMGEHRRLMDRAAEHLPRDAVQVALQVRPEYRRLAFKEIRALGLPQGTLVAVLRRAGEARVPRGDTVVEPGDVLVLLATEKAQPALRDWMEEVERP